MGRELVMYSRTIGCPFVSIAKRILRNHNIPYREIYIDKDKLARERVREWTGFLSVPTIIVTEPGGTLPIATPDPLPAGESPRGIDRNTMITEPRDTELEDWLKKHGFIR